MPGTERVVKEVVRMLAFWKGMVSLGVLGGWMDGEGAGLRVCNARC